MRVPAYIFHVPFALAACLALQGPAAWADPSAALCQTAQRLANEEYDARRAELLTKFGAGFTEAQNFVRSITPQERQLRAAGSSDLYRARLTRRMNAISARFDDFECSLGRKNTHPFARGCVDSDGTPQRRDGLASRRSIQLDPDLNVHLGYYFANPPGVAQENYEIPISTDSLAAADRSVREFVNKTIGRRAAVVATLTAGACPTTDGPTSILQLGQTPTTDARLATRDAPAQELLAVLDPREPRENAPLLTAIAL